jgi:hypothetical protein
LAGTPFKPLLGELLVETGTINRHQLNRALAEQQRGKERIGETLIRLNLTTREAISNALAEQRKRWYAATFGATMMVFQPVSVVARTVTAALNVSVQVVNTASFNPRLVGSESGSGDGIKLQATSAMQTLARITVGRIRIEPAAGATPAQASSYIPPAPNYSVTMTPIKSQIVEMTPRGNPMTLPVKLAANAADESIGVEIDY